MIYLPENLSFWIMNYGSIAFFVLIFLGFLFLPLPQNLIAFFAGMLIYRGKMAIVPGYCAAFFGAFLAITATYYIGRYAENLLFRYGRYVGMTKVRIKKFDNWYERFGKYTLLIGYYFPILRRIMGYAAGLDNFNFKEFIALTFIGSFFWATIMLGIGYLIEQYSLVLV